MMYRRMINEWLILERLCLLLRAERKRVNEGVDGKRKNSYFRHLIAMGIILSNRTLSIRV